MKRPKLHRLLLLGGCVAAGFVAALLFPALPAAVRALVQRLWARAALHVLGVTLASEGEPPRGGILLVANHVSWLDVLAIVAVCPAAFVCKQEIASWPALGWLLRRSGTLFMRRGSARAAWRAVGQIGPRLAGGSSVAVFPEATTTRGDAVLPFFPAMFQAAVNAQGVVQPVALAYSDAVGARCREASYEGETSFGESLLAIAQADGLNVTVSFLPAFAAATHCRRSAARRAHEMISSRIRHAGVAVRSCELRTLRPA